MVKRKITHWFDPVLLFLLISLLGYGLVVLYSAGGVGLVERQTIRIGLGLFAMLFIAQIRPERFEQFTPLVFAVSVLLLVAVLFFGVTVKGAKRWLDLGISLQPSELCKITLPMMVAWIFRHASLPPDWKHLLGAFSVIGLCTGLIYQQPDLGTSILIALSGIFVIYLAGISWKLIIGGGLLAVMASPIVWYFMHEYQKQRVLMFLNPESDPLNRGWNIIQSKIAIGSGGVSGKGWQQGSQTQLDFLPEHSTDFILSVLSEEFGFIGVTILFLLYTLIIMRCLFIASQAKNTYNRLICGALTLILFVYITINAGMISGVFPVVGVPLPLVSYGGTSVLTLLASFGIIMSIHTHKKLIQQ
ncbi:rod shape-determining protein RodA [Marinicella rhabdoformis]|uniref:rod shape-determining protein RodA n=1 Tax=Marinicella rhabdoformis TaxID=2580566 RepID=UPI0012AEDC3E|nr:rod shape-determining protein RodA [Marinicella rhabdoformis]